MVYHPYVPFEETLYYAITQHSEAEDVFLHLFQLSKKEILYVLHRVNKLTARQHLNQMLSWTNYTFDSFPNPSSSFP